MKVALWTTAAFAAMAMSASAANAGTVTSPVNFFSPLPVTPATTSTAAGFDNNSGVKSATMFVDDYEFTIAGNYDTTLSGDFDNNVSGSKITSIDLSLFKGIPGASTQIDTTGLEVLPTGKGTTSYFLDDVLAPGVDYYLQADVTVPAKSIGKYSLSAIASPISAVPEPGTWTLMFAGVAMMGGMLRLGRRNGWAMNVA